MSESDLLAALGGAAVSFEVAPGVAFSLRPMLMDDAKAYREFRKAHPDDNEAAAVKLVSLCASGPDGKPLAFEFVQRCPASVVGKIAERLAKLNGWGDEAGNS